MIPGNGVDPTGDPPSQGVPRGDPPSQEVPTGDPPSQEVQVIDVLENVMYQWILGTFLRLLTIARPHALTDVRGRLVSGLDFSPIVFSECFSWARCIRCFKSRQNCSKRYIITTLGLSCCCYPYLLFYRQTNDFNDSKFYSYW